MPTESTAETAWSSERKTSEIEPHGCDEECAHACKRGGVADLEKSPQREKQIAAHEADDRDHVGETGGMPRVPPRNGGLEARSPLIKHPHA